VHLSAVVCTRYGPPEVLQLREIEKPVPRHEEGIPRLDQWMGSEDPDVRWVMGENLRKKRLAAVAGGRFERWRTSVATG